MLFFLSSVLTNFLFILGSVLLFLLLLLFCLQNAILIILTLVCIFLLSCFLFIFLEAYYLSLVFIIVYVGAIAILFLFVIMLTNKLYLTLPLFWFLFSQLLLVLFFLEGFFWFVNVGTLADSFWFFQTYPELFFTGSLSRVLFLADPLTSFGQTLYGVFSSYVILLGILLVVVLVGIVVLLRGAPTDVLVVSRDVEVIPVVQKNIWSADEFVRLKQ